ncbi:hypothetical protein V2A60_005976 [Cordyceps javanica]|uniref:Lipase n=1 Tax=Cordyceps javanica TaxID=43265 RepID=A0A545UR45_9HYPO|nr:lipase precursor [Cordyceps javanica]TQW03874.1 lipase precursor [Cordyceps javanica]
MKIRFAPGNLTSKLKYLARSDQILYRTSDTNDDPTWAVSTVLVPKKWERTLPGVVSYQMSYDSACIDSSPSYQLATALDGIRYDVLDKMLDRGWHVSIPDYEGPFASFGAGRMAGELTLDSMRAFEFVSNGRYGVSSEKLHFAAWGYSGGALATAWSYLRKIEHAVPIKKKLRSYVIGGLPVDLLAALNAWDGTEAAGTALNAISGLMNEYPVVNDTIQLAAKTTGPFNITVFDRVKTQTFKESKAEYEFQNLSNYFVDGLNQVVGQLRAEKFDRKIALTKLPAVEPLDLPQHFLVYHAVDDKIAPIEDVDNLMYKHWCKSRNVIDLHRNHEGGHVETGDAGVDVAMDWIAKRFEYLFRVQDNPTDLDLWEDPQPRCDVREVSYKPSLEDMDGYID